MKRTSATRWVRRTFTWYFSAKVVLAILVIAVSAASITATSSNYQAEIGSSHSVNSNLLAGDKGFSKPSSSTSATGSCPLATTFGASPGSANNAISAGDIVYDVQVNTTATTPAAACFTVTLTLFLSDGSQTTKSLMINSGVLITAGQTIDCKLDIGTTSLPLSPFSFRLTVQ